MLPDSAIRNELKQTFRSLRHRNFRIYCLGQLISLCGTWMQNLALAWLVFRITKSAWVLGVVSFASLAPVLVLGLAGGWVADHFDRRKILLTTQTLAMLQAATLAFLTITQRIEVWQVVLLAATLGVITAFEMPARQAFLIDLVDREDLVNSVSLNASMFHGSRTIGPALAGLLVGWTGEGVCFMLNSLSYLGSLTALLLLRLTPLRNNQQKSMRSFWALDALRFAFSRSDIREILILTAVTSLFGMQYLMLMPVFVSQILHRHAASFGVLTASAGIGALMATLWLANRATGDILKKGVGYAGLGFACALFGFALSHNFYLSVVLIVFMGLFVTAQLSGSHSLIQLAVTDELRGRVMSIYMVILMGMGPVGSLFVGAAAYRWGAAVTMAWCACFCAVAALIYVARKQAVGLR